VLREPSDARPEEDEAAIGGRVGFTCNHPRPIAGTRAVAVAALPTAATADVDAERTAIGCSVKPSRGPADVKRCPKVVSTSHRSLSRQTRRSSARGGGAAAEDAVDGSSNTIEEIWM
jgi:hypothetical protein